MHTSIPRRQNSAINYSLFVVLNIDFLLFIDIKLNNPKLTRKSKKKSKAIPVTGREGP
jgi:hypothetical protein